MTQSHINNSAKNALKQKQAHSHSAVQGSEDSLVTLPVSALETLNLSTSGQPIQQSLSSLSGPAHTSHTSRDEPFACFLKEQWKSGGTITIVQSHN